MIVGLIGGGDGVFIEIRFMEEERVGRRYRKIWFYVEFGGFLCWVVRK